MDALVIASGGKKFVSPALSSGGTAFLADHSAAAQPAW
jgi:hypothetical protein